MSAPSTLTGVKALVASTGSHWFDASTMAFFQSRVSTRVYPSSGGTYFVSSERRWAEPRMYSVRFVALDGTADTVGEFQGYRSARAAHAAAARLAREVTP